MESHCTHWLHEPMSSCKMEWAWYDLLWPSSDGSDHRPDENASPEQGRAAAYRRMSVNGPAQGSRQVEKEPFVSSDELAESQFFSASAAQRLAGHSPCGAPRHWARVGLRGVAWGAWCGAPMPIRPIRTIRTTRTIRKIRYDTPRTGRWCASGGSGGFRGFRVALGPQITPCQYIHRICTYPGVPDHTASGVETSTACRLPHTSGFPIHQACFCSVLPMRRRAHLSCSRRAGACSDI